MIDWLAALPAGDADDDDDGATTADGGRGRGGVGPRSVKSRATETLAPRLAPALHAVHFSRATNHRAHGLGEPGGEGSILADALAAPAGRTLANALVASGGSLDALFVHTLLQANDMCCVYTPV